MVNKGKKEKQQLARLGRSGVLRESSACLEYNVPQIRSKNETEEAG